MDLFLPPLFIPSPSQGVWHIGLVPIRAYALCVLAGILVAWLITKRRWVRLGGDGEKMETLLLVTVVCGILGARLYYVLIEWGRFFGPQGTWYHAFFVWQGGLGIWGGLAVGTLTALLMARLYGFNASVLLDCFAPALPLAQALGRFGNYFNQELYGAPTTLPWGLEIDPVHRVAGYGQYATFHPTFLYEALWDLALAAFLLFFVERKLKWGRGKLMATYVVGYAVGRFLVESLRIDPVKVIGPFRVNAWVTLVLGLIALVGLIVLLKTRPGANEPGSAGDLPVAARAADGPGSPGGATRAARGVEGTRSAGGVPGRESSGKRSRGADEPGSAGGVPEEDPDHDGDAGTEGEQVP
ncbi:MAG: prolipoprotein diacylglyceryl transferase [Propionibacteriaceae bacterium]|jgi:prolipoprotein diacylglyceryl transferase|nr:prolipoprotein diacylglyceryl transferase [Propionibacteriaceae bacterium]